MTATDTAAPEDETARDASLWTDTEILERLIARNALGVVRLYDTWCYDGERYPDARSALAVFMTNTTPGAP